MPSVSITHQITIFGLIRTLAAAEQELRNLGVMTKNGDLTGGYTELLVCQRLGLKKCEDNTPHVDAVDLKTKHKYQIKGIRSEGRLSQKFSRLPSLEDKNFDYFVGVVFDSNYVVRRAAKVPYELVRERSGTKLKGGFQFSLTNTLMKHPCVEDIRCFLESERDLGGLI